MGRITSLFVRKVIQTDQRLDARALLDSVGIDPDAPADPKVMVTQSLSQGIPTVSDMDGASDSIQTFVDKAKNHGIKRLVLLSGCEEEEVQACERIVRNSGIEWTIVRASWFNQNFTEGAFVEMVQAGQVALPAADTSKPFVDVEDIAEVAVAVTGLWRMES